MTSRVIFLLSIILFATIINAQIQNHCGPNETMMNCGKLCEKTCRKLIIPFECKNLQCLLAECACDYSKGYYRQESTDKCVKLADCFKKVNPQPQNNCTYGGTASHCGKNM